MKKNLVLGLLIMATGLVLAGCASLNQKVDGLLASKWDKAEKTNAFLYFDESIKLHKVDGKEYTNIYGQAIGMQGSGTVKNPKLKLAIPAGERVLTISYKQESMGGEMLFTDARNDVPYTFVEKRYYQLAASKNGTVQNPKWTEAQATANRIIDEESAKGAQGSAARINQARNDLTKVQVEMENNGQMYATNVEIFDITGGKKKNSPSIIVTVKPWEQK